MPPERARPKKSLGQHFMTDSNIVRKIIAACALTANDTVLEIGPGTGILTRAIAPAVKHLIAVEADAQLARQLRREFDSHTVSVITADILTYDFTSLPLGTKIIGNLPYYISSPIIENIMMHRHRLGSVFITVQWEFGKRMVARPNSKDYSALSVLVQYYMDVRMLFKIKPQSFTPPPKIDSCFMHLAAKPRPPRPVCDETFLRAVVHCAFQQRRKMIINALSSLVDKKNAGGILMSLGIAQKKRPEELGVSDFVRITNALLPCRN